VKRGRHSVPIASSVPPTLHSCRPERGLGQAEANHHPTDSYPKLQMIVQH